VSAHEVRRACGFSVVYGPVRAEDLPAFLDARLKASADMRRVRFRTRDRAVLIPVEIAAGARLAVPIAIAFLLAGGIDGNGYSMASLRLVGGQSASLLLAAFLAAAVGGPLLLPWLPGRPFALKGASLGLVLAGLLLACHFGATPIFGSAFHAAAWALLVPTVTSFVIMNFTGSSTFTSLSGVLREMRVALPMQIAGAVAGLGPWVAGLFA
jgi:acetyl-CoA decarbonylase/synthase complex subunit gamma